LRGITENLLIGLIMLEDRLTFQRYFHFLQKQLPLMLEDVPLLTRQGMSLQQDGALPHFGRQMTTILPSTFQTVGVAEMVQLFGQRNYQNFGFELCRGHMKSMAYAVKSDSKAELLTRIIDSHQKWS
jgi:hypothetical protein